jgi:hypothetical protein
MTIIKNELDQINIFAKEPEMYVSQTDAERYALESHAERAEKVNGLWSMVGLVAGIISYSLTGNFFFGIF